MKPEHQPGDPAPTDGCYEALNIFGSPTGQKTRLAAGEPLPPLPHRHTWRLIREQEGG